jgi:WD40 repeat protein
MTVAFSPDGKRIASAGGEQLAAGRSEITIWDAATGKVERRLEGHAAPVACVAFSPDGKYLASAEDQKGLSEGTVKVWEAATGQVAANFAGHACVAFSPDGQRLACAARQKSVKDYLVVVRNWVAGMQVRAFKVPDTLVTSVAFSPDGKRLAAGSYVRVGGGMSLLGPPGVAGPSARIWDLDSGAERVLKHPGGIAGVTFSPGGERLATAGGDKNVKIWEAATGRELRTLTGHTFIVSSVAYSPDGRRLASASWDQTVKVWDSADGKELRTFKGHTEAVAAVAFSPDGKRLASGGHDRAVKVWDATRDQEALTFGPSGEPSGFLAFDPDSKHLATGGYGVTLWDASTGEVVRAFKERLVNVTPIAGAFRPDGKRLAVVAPTLLKPGIEVKMWDTANGKAVSSFPAGGFVSRLAFSPDGKRLALASLREIHICDAGTGERRVTLRHEQANVTELAFRPDGRWLATGGATVKDGRIQGEVRLWDAATGKEVRRFRPQEGQILSVVFSRDGRRLAAAGTYRVVVWDPASGGELQSFRLTPALMAAFNADTRRLAASGLDGQVTLWDVSTGQQVLSLKGFGGALRALAFSPDDTRLAACGVEGTEARIRVWDARPLPRNEDGGLASGAASARR